MKTFAWISASAAVIIGFLFMKSTFEIERLKMESLISKKQYSLLEDQCRDYEFKISNTRTYEDGFKDALIKMNHPEGGTFQEGYEAAKIVFGNGSYADGYHNAIAQFGWIKENNSQGKVINTSNPNKEKENNGQGKLIDTSNPNKE